MRPIREAIVLPVLFLTVALLGGLRIGASVVLVSPPLVALVLGVLLVGALARGGILLPGLLVNAARSPIENANGVAVVVTLLAASAQVFNLLTPDTGLFHLVFTAFFFVQILTTIAGTSGPRQLLRSVSVLLACAFVLRFIVLENLYAPGTGTAKRMLTLLVEGASFGAIDYRPHAAATGYVALLTLALYLTGLWLLSTAYQRHSTAIAVVPQRDGELILLVLVVAAMAGASGGRDDNPPVARMAISADPTRAPRTAPPPVPVSAPA